MINLNYFKPKTQKKFDLVRSREKFKKRKSKNLKFLLEKRFLWMDKYLISKKIYIFSVANKITSGGSLVENLYARIMYASRELHF